MLASMPTPQIHHGNKAEKSDNQPRQIKKPKKRLSEQFTESPGHKQQRPKSLPRKSLTWRLSYIKTNSSTRLL
jgi:hypothetical protein